MLLKSFNTLAILISSIGVSTSFGQCPPVSEGKLPQFEMIKNVTVPTMKVLNPAEQVDTNGKIRVDHTKRQKVNGDSTTPPLIKKPKPGKKLNTVEGKDAGLPGPVSIQVPGVGSSSKIVEQDGRFIIVGASDIVNGQVNEQGIFLARFEEDGTLDPGFGQGGSIRIILFAQNNLVNNSSPSIALSSNGKIIVVRTITDRFPGAAGSRVAMVRLNYDGALDPTFGNGGLVYTTIKDQFKANSVAVQRDDKVIVGGSSGHKGDCRDEPCTMYATLTRYQSNGQLDPSFGKAGIVRTVWFVGQPAAPSSESSFLSLLIQENGLIVAVGAIRTGRGDLVDSYKMLIAEYLPTGELNPVFGKGGATMLSFDGPYQTFEASSLEVRENGRILVGGTANLYSGDAGGSAIVDQAFIFAQLRPSGELDVTFGSSGKVVVNVNPRTGTSPLQPLDELTKVMLDPTGDIYAVGVASGPLGNSESAINFVALNSNGSMKRNFGKGGLYSLGTYNPWHINIAEDALLKSNGRLVISGSHWTRSGNFVFPDSFVLWAYSINAGPTGCPFPTIKEKIK